MKRTPASSLAFALAFPLSVGVASAAADPDPGTDFIKNISYAGSGCPQDSVVVSIGDDARTFKVKYSQFIAEIGPGIPLARSRKNCQLNLTMRAPQGFSFAIAAADYHGYASLAEGAMGLHKATHYFHGVPDQPTTWRGFTGPYEGGWHIHDEPESAFLAWSPCGVERTTLNVNTQLRLDRRSSSSSSYSTMTMESQGVEQTYHILWRECGA